jgi:acyl-CoA hydrolase
MKVLDLEKLDFAAIVRRDDAVMWGQAAAEPVVLTRALLAQRHDIGGFDAFIGATWSETADVSFTDCVRFRSYCGAGSNRALAKAGVLDILPSHYSQLGAMIRSGRLRVDVLLVQVAPADSEGHYSLSLAHEYLVPAIDAARVVVAEVNERAPWTFGERALTAADIDFAIYTSRLPLRAPVAALTDVERLVARRAAGLIDDGATLQFGVGAIPEAVLAELSDRRDLGVHSGTLVDQVAYLAQAGVITNACKSVDRGVSVAGVLMGGEAACEYAHRNPTVQFRSSEYTHAPGVLAALSRFAAINSAVEVDLSGQINAEVAGGVYVGAVGGALDFLRAAQRSEGGLPIIALPSAAGSGTRRVSRIVAQISGPVSTPRSDAGLIVTEHGVADLRGLSIAQRIPRMLAVADPQFHDELQKAILMTR